MKNLNIVLILITIFTGIASAQNDVYYTRDATLKISGEFKGERVSGMTPSLGVKLDYETTKITIRFHLNTLEFNVDTLNTLVQSNLSEVVFDGALSLEYINTEGHPPLDFMLEGIVTSTDLETSIEGSGTLYHTDTSENFACLLSIKMNPKLDDFNIDVPGLENEIELVITQALLQKDKN